MTKHNNVTISRELLRQALAQLEINRTNFYKGPSKSMCKCLAGGNDEAITALRTALEQPAQEPVAWTPVANCLPASGVVVLACYRNRLGNLRRIRAEWVAAKTQEADGSDERECAEYDEATDTFYTAQGWYERIDNWGDYSSVAVTEGEVTHWMPLPPAPDAAPQAQQPAPVQDRWEARADELLMRFNDDNLPEVSGSLGGQRPAVKLTDEEIQELVVANAGYGNNFNRVARAVEQAVLRKNGVIT